MWAEDVKVMVDKRRETPLGGLAWGIGITMPWLLRGQSVKFACGAQGPC